MAAGLVYRTDSRCRSIRISRVVGEEILKVIEILTTRLVDIY